MELLIVSGMSGSGKSSVLTILEDMGYYCIDNFPINLYEVLPNLVKDQKVKSKLVLTLDVRNRQSFDVVSEMFTYLRASGVKYSLMFIDTNSEDLLLRYKETRRNHPLMIGNNKTLEMAIEEERYLLENLRAESDYLIDTSDLLIIELRENIRQLFGSENNRMIAIDFVSFGFKFGILADADIVFDLRCLSNPYYEPELREKTGNDKVVRDFVMNNDESKGLYKHILDYLEYSIPLYIKEGKSQIVVGLGCTGGKHRSVTFVNKLYEDVASVDVRKLKRHRDINKR